MRSILATLLFATILVIAVVQRPAAQSAAPAPPDKTFSSAADVAALIAKLDSERKGGEVVRGPILRLAPYSANLEHRTAVADASVHERDIEIFYVVDGGATMVMGGKLVNEKRANGPNLNGSAIEGGTSREIAKGDFILVPENTPHWFSKINGKLDVMSLHMPHPVPTAAP